MSIHDKTLKLVTNLDRAAIEARLADVRKAAQAASLGDVAGAHAARAAAYREKVVIETNWAISDSGG